MTKPITVNLSCYRGQTYNQNLYFKRGGVPIDLTGKTAKAQIRRYLNDKDTVSEFKCTVYPEYGKVSMSLTANQSAGINPGIYVYDLKMTGDDDLVDYWIEGTFSVSGRVTE